MFYFMLQIAFIEVNVMLIKNECNVLLRQLHMIDTSQIKLQQTHRENLLKFDVELTFQTHTKQFRKNKRSF